MKRALGIARIGSITLEVGWSWLIVAPLVGIALFASIDPATGTASTRAVVAAGGAVVLFGSVVAHELGHALVALNRGVEVERVAIFLLGGFSEMDLDSVEPRTERAIVLAGPIVSGSLGGFLVAGSVAPDWAGSGHVLAVLAVVNLGVALFNLLPAYPLDGGRWLRSALEGRGRSRPDAERVAVRVGAALGVAVVVGAVILSVAGRPESLVALPVGAMLIGLARIAARSEADPDPETPAQRI